MLGRVDGGAIFIKSGRPSSPSEPTAAKRHSMGVFPDPFPSPRPNIKSGRKPSPQSDSGKRGRSRTQGEVPNVAFSMEVPDIKIRDYIDSDEEMSV